MLSAVGLCPKPRGLALWFSKADKHSGKLRFPLPAFAKPHTALMSFLNVALSSDMSKSALSVSAYRYCVKRHAKT